MIWFIVDAGVLMLLIKLIGGEDVSFWIALAMGGLTSLTMFGVGGLVLEYGIGAFFGLVASVGVVLSLLVWTLGEVKPGRSFLIGGIFIVYRFGLSMLFALGSGTSFCRYQEFESRTNGKPCCNDQRFIKSAARQPRLVGSRPSP